MSKKSKNTKNQSENKILKTLRIIKNVIFAVILVLLTGVVVLSLVTRISGKTPSIMGYSLYRVSSGSMEPALEVGDIILSKDCDPMTLKQGDIITYDGVSGEFAGKRVTHRVVKEPYKEDGKYYLVTKGDDNPVEDTPIELSNVRGIFVCKVSVIQGLYSFFITPWGLLTMIGLIILAFFNEIILFFKAITGKLSAPTESIEDIIERYQKENHENPPAEKKENPDKKLPEPSSKKRKDSNKKHPESGSKKRKDSNKKQLKHADKKHKASSSQKSKGNANHKKKKKSSKRKNRKKR